MSLDFVFSVPSMLAIKFELAENKIFSRPNMAHMNTVWQETGANAMTIMFIHM
jgi:hypothetical protein